MLPDLDAAVTNAWVGEGVPIGGSKALSSGFEHRLQREPKTDDIRVQVVCNEPEMLDERDSVHRVYRDGRGIPFDVDVLTDVSTDQLQATIERESDFFHYIGHIDERGFRCPDGWFTAEADTSVGADVFLLNSCRSYDQGESLIRQGATAGIVTVTDLLNYRAAAIGQTMALFLNHGFPLYVALDVVRDTYRFGDAYALIGDAHIVLSQPSTTIPEYVELQSRSEDAAMVVHRTFPSHWAGLGTDVCPSYEAGDRHYLLGGEMATVELSEEELEALLAFPMPLRDGDDLRFSLDPMAEDGS